MKARIVRIGDSKGIRIPKPLLGQTGLSEEVTIEAEGNRLVSARRGGRVQVGQRRFGRVTRTNRIVLRELESARSSTPSR